MSSSTGETRKKNQSLIISYQICSLIFFLIYDCEHLKHLMYIDMTDSC